MHLIIHKVQCKFKEIDYICKNNFQFYKQMKNVIKHNLNEDYLNSLSEKELTKEMQSWTPSEQVKHVCPEGVMPLEDFRRIGIQMIKDMYK